MSIADELSKLNELKEKGAITQAEFDKQKATLLGAPKASKRAGGLVWKVLVGVVGALGLASLLVANFNKGTSGLPTCDSAQAKSTLSEAFNRSQFARAMNLSAVEVTDSKESAYDAKGSLRTCSGNVAMNNRNTAHVTYKMQGRPDGQYLLEFEVVEESVAPATAAPTAQSSVAPSPAPMASSPSAVNLPAAVTATRYGPLSITDDQHVLFQGKPLNPPLDGDNSLAVSQKFEIGGDDVLLIQKTNGTGCPAEFYFVRVSAAGAGATPSFGTCSDEAKVGQDGDSVRVTLPGFAGSSQSAAEQQAAAKERHVFVYRAGAVAELAR